MNRIKVLQCKVLKCYLWSFLFVFGCEDTSSVQEEMREDGGEVSGGLMSGGLMNEGGSNGGEMMSGGMMSGGMMSGGMMSGGMENTMTVGGMMEEDQDSTPNWDQIRMNELVAKGDPSDWVEIYNLGDHDVNLAGCLISDDPDQIDQAVIPSQPSAIVPAGGFTVLLINNDTFGFKLGSVDSLILSTPSGELIDEVSYEEGQSPEGGSYGRLPDGVGGFQTLYVQSPLSPNEPGIAPVCGDEVCDVGENCVEDCSFCGDGACDEGEMCVEDCETCGDGFCAEGEECVIDCQALQCGDGVCNVGEECEEDCLSDLAVKINEIVSWGDPDWVEFYNAGMEEIDLNGYWISDDLDEPQKWILDSFVIEAGGFLSLDISDETVGFKLKKDEAFYLTSPTGMLIDFIDWQEGDCPENQSYGRLEDGGMEWGTLLIPTRDQSNVQ